jgi:UDP-glucose 4-epimerase
MRVLITGNRGFVGRTTEQVLVSAGIETVGYDIAEGFDILDADALAQRAKGCHAILHLAAVEDKDSTKTIRTNLVGTLNVLRACDGSDVKKVIFLSSVDALGVFQGEGVPKYLPLDDDYPCHPRAAYSVSKKLGEEMCRYFSLDTGISILSLRPPGIWNEMTYGKIVVARKQRPEYEWDPFWEYGAFIDIRDLAEAVALALRKDFVGFHSLLIAANDITTSGMTAMELVRKLHPNVEWRGGKDYEKDPYRSLVQSENVKALLGWNPQYTWRRYIERNSEAL